MKKQIKGFILGFIVCAVIIASVPAFAKVATKSIKVLLNSISVKVNTTTLAKDNIIYNSKIYVNASSVSKALGKTYSWDKKSNVVTIKDKPTPTPSPSLTPTPTPNKIATYSNPASMNEQIQIDYTDLFDTYSAKITVEDIIRGSEAWSMVQNANMFNDPAKDGYEYIVIKIKFELLDIPDGKVFNLSSYDFKLVSANGKEYDNSTVVDPVPSLDSKLYKGASNEGYTVFEVEQTDVKPVIAFGRNYDGTGGIWFKAY